MDRRRGRGVVRTCSDNCGDRSSNHWPKPRPFQRSGTEVTSVRVEGNGSDFRSPQREVGRLNCRASRTDTVSVRQMQDGHSVRSRCARWLPNSSSANTASLLAGFRGRWIVVGRELHGRDRPTAVIGSRSTGRNHQSLQTPSGVKPSWSFPCVIAAQLSTRLNDRKARAPRLKSLHCAE